MATHVDVEKGLYVIQLSDESHLDNSVLRIDDGLMAAYKLANR